MRLVELDDDLEVYTATPTYDRILARVHVEGARQARRSGDRRTTALRLVWGGAARRRAVDALLGDAR